MKNKMKEKEEQEKRASADIYKLYENSVEFHGHSCPGLAIGVRAAAEAVKIMGLSYSKDEEIVCITENDACGVDGIQRILGCTTGKGNLIHRMRGKHAYSFFDRKTGNGIRLVLKELPKTVSGETKQKYILEAPVEEIFDVVKPKYSLPEKARIFQSVVCEECGESTAEPYIRLENGKKLCLDCYSKYDRI